MDYNIDIFARDILYRMNKSDKVEFVSSCFDYMQPLEQQEFFELIGEEKVVRQLKDDLIIEELKTRGYIITKEIAIWQKSSVNGVSVLFVNFEPITIGLRPSVVSHNAFCPILFPDSSKRMHDAMFMYEIESVHELQALLDIWMIRHASGVRVKVKIKP